MRTARNVLALAGAIQSYPTCSGRTWATLDEITSHMRIHYGASRNASLHMDVYNLEMRICVLSCEWGGTD